MSLDGDTSPQQSVSDVTEAAPSNIVDEIFGFLLATMAYEEAEVRAQFGSGLSEVQFGKALWLAKERAREQASIEFIPRGDGGGFVRATDLQKLRRGQQFHRTGIVKMKRSLRVLDKVDPDGLSTEHRQQLARAVERQGRATLRAEQEASLRKPPVTVCETPKVPRSRGTGDGQ